MVPLLVSLSSWMAANVVGAKISQKMWERPCCEGVWPYLDPWDVVHSSFVRVSAPIDGGQCGREEIKVAQ